MMVSMVVVIVHLGALGKRIVIIVTSGGVVELLVSFQVKKISPSSSIKTS